MNVDFGKIIKATGIWPLVAGFLAFVFLLMEANLAALFIAMSGALSLRSARGAYARYGLDESRRPRACAGLGVTAVLVLLFIPSAGAPRRDASGETARAETQYAAPGASAEAPDQNTSGVPAGSAGTPLARVGEPAPSNNTLEYLAYCTATDGDTLSCNSERIRLLGIDAPEMPGHCRPGRICAPGDPYSSQSNLQFAMNTTLRIARIGQDHYGRTVGIVYAGNTNLSCHQLRTGHAVYIAEWDDGGRIAAQCG